MKKHLIFAILTVVFFAGCTGKKEEVFIPLDAGLKQNLSFKQGSYWIYRDSLTGREDSFFVKSYNYSPSKWEGNFSDEEVVMVVNEHPLNGSISDTSQWTWSLMTGANLNVSYTNYASQVQFTIVPLTSAYPFQPDASTTGRFTVIVPSFTLNSHTYDTTAIVHVTDYGTTNQYTFYVNKSVGFPKIKFDNGSLHYCWELERSYIVR